MTTRETVESLTDTTGSSSNAIALFDRMADESYFGFNAKLTLREMIEGDDPDVAAFARVLATMYDRRHQEPNRYGDR